VTFPALSEARLDVSILNRRKGEALALVLLASSYGALAVVKLVDGGAGVRGPALKFLFTAAGVFEGLLSVALIWQSTRRVAIAISAAWSFILFSVNLVPSRWIGGLLEGCRCFGAMETSAAGRQLVASLLFGASVWCCVGGSALREESSHAR